MFKVGQFNSLSRTAKVYVCLVVTSGAIVLVHSVYQLVSIGIASQWYVLAALTLLTGSFTVKVPSTPVHISVSETFVFVAVILFGPEAGVVIVLLECVVISFWNKLRGNAIHKILFNAAAPSVAIWVAAHAFFLISGFQPYAAVGPEVAR